MLELAEEEELADRMAGNRFGFEVQWQAPTWQPHAPPPEPDDESVFWHSAVELLDSEIEHALTWGTRVPQGIVMDPANSQYRLVYSDSESDD